MVDNKSVYNTVYLYRVRSIVVAADNSTIAWGPSPTYGELVCTQDT